LTGTASEFRWLTPICPGDPLSIKSLEDLSNVTVAVYGLGKMGLPLAAVFADNSVTFAA